MGTRYETSRLNPVVERPEAHFYEPSEVWKLLEAAGEYDN